MNAFKAAWLAGLTDGEGSICVRVSRSKMTYTVTWSMGMTHLETMKEVQRLVWNITGRKYRLYQYRDKAGHKVCYKLMIGRRAAVMRMLDTLSVHLVTKKRLAELGQWLLKQPREYRTGKQSKTLKPDVIAAIDEMRALNHKGIPCQAPVREGVET